MKASEAVQQIVWLMSLYGDFELYAEDYPFDYLVTKIEYRKGEEREDWPDCRPKETKTLPPRFVIVSE